MVTVTDLARLACEQVFEGYGVPVHVRRRSSRDDCGWFGMIDLTGDGVHATLLLSPNTEALRRSYPLEGQPTPDWVGELLNQVAGRLQNDLGSRGARVTIGTPWVVPDRRGQERCGTEEPEVVLSVRADVAPGFELKEPEAGPASGDLILF